MSAEPARTGGPDSRASAAVILFRPSTRRREEDVPAEDRTPLRTLAETTEQLYLGYERTLTDPDTAQAFRIALEAVEILLEGARAKGVVQEDGHRELRAIIEALKAAPDIL